MCACVCVYCVIINNMNWEQGTNGKYKEQGKKHHKQKTKRETCEKENKKN